MSTILILKLILVPTLIALVTLAGRRWGASVAGWLSAFPVVAGPILLFVALEQGAAFAARSAAATLSAVLAVLVFGLSYAWAATRFSWPICAMIGFAAYFVAVLALNYWAPTLLFALPVVLITLLLAPRLYPLAKVELTTTAAPANDLFFRMAAGAILVLVVTHFAAGMGPTLSGVLAMFPVMGSVLVVFSHRNYGAGFAIHLLRGMVLGFYAFSTFCVVLALTLTKLSIGAAFFFAFGGALVVQALSRFRLRPAG